MRVKRQDINRIRIPDYRITDRLTIIWIPKTYCAVSAAGS